MARGLARVVQTSTVSYSARTCAHRQGSKDVWQSSPGIVTRRLCQCKSVFKQCLLAPLRLTLLDLTGLGAWTCPGQPHHLQSRRPPPRASYCCSCCSCCSAAACIISSGPTRSLHKNCPALPLGKITRGHVLMPTGVLRRASRKHPDRHDTPLRLATWRCVDFPVFISGLAGYSTGQAQSALSRP